MLIPARFEKIPEISPLNPRRLATQTVKARGIDYLMIDDHYLNAADVKRDPSRWGLEFIAERASNRLYRIQ